MDRLEKTKSDSNDSQGELDGLNVPVTAAFDGERILVTNLGGNSISLWKATDLTPLGSLSTGPTGIPLGACSDGVNSGSR